MAYDEEKSDQVQQNIDAASDIGKKAVKKGIEKSAQNAAKEGGKNVAKEGAKNAAKEGAKSAAKEGAKQVGKEGAKAAATHTAAAGAAATGVGVPVAAAIEVASAAIGLAKKGLNTVSTTMTGEKFKLWEYIVLPIAFMFIFMFLIASSKQGMVGSSSEKYSEEQYYDTQVDKGRVTDARKMSLRDLIKYFISGEDEKPGEYNSDYVLQESITTANIPVFEKAFKKAYEYAKKELLIIITERDYDFELTLASFNENEYPFNNINYAELISIVSQKDVLNIENLKYKSFKILFNNTDKIKYLYKMKVEDAYATIRYYVRNGTEVRLAEGEEPPTNDDGESIYDVETKEVLYGKVTLVHYDLRSLYEDFLELEPNEPNKIYDNINNIDMIDKQEQYIRHYARDEETNLLGPTDRTIWDWGFESYHPEVGASLYDLLKDFFDKTGIPIEDDMPIDFPIDGDLEDITAYFLKMAFSKLGTTYSKDLRNVDGYFDCSSFVAWVYRQVGIEFGSYSPTAAEICRYLFNNGYEVSSSYDSSSMKPGDIIFWADTDPSVAGSRYKHVTHTGIYVGNGMIIDASSSKGEVVYRNVWGTGKIVSVCRPIQQ